jgi:hypothetical protein
MMNQTRWIDRSQPGRLVQGTMMLYITGAFDILSGLTWSPIFLLIAAAKIFGGHGIANEKKIGYQAAVAAAIISVVLSIWILTVGEPVFALIGLAIDVWVLTLLLHDTSRSYARIWFK